MLKSENPKIVVIGAGLAGLTTAYRLHKQGLNVSVYEARRRVGGRVFTVFAEKSIAELGGYNITDGGPAGNLLRIIKECGLELVENQVSLNASYFTGEELIPINELLRRRKFQTEDLQAKLNQLAKKSKNMQEVLKSFLGEEDHLYKAIAIRLAGYEGASIEKLSSFYVQTLYYMLLGGLAFVHQGTEDGENYLDLLSIKGGNSLLPEKMAKMLGNKVHLSKVLKRVKKEKDGYSLTFQDGQIVKADILVLGIPCSVYEDITFDDGIIPEERLRAIKNVGYGTNAKIMVPFSKLSPKRIGLSNDNVNSFFNFEQSIYTIYCSGESGHFTADTISHVYNDTRPMMEMGFGDLCPPITNIVMAHDESFGTYEGPVGYSWPNDSYAKGSYSYIAPGQETIFTATKKELGEEVKELFAPIDEVLYFVGEHATVLADVPGTMEAACESGERTARMIANSLKLFPNDIS